MLNKEALKTAQEAFYRRYRSLNTTNLEALQAAIEAFIVALPDEDGLVEKLRYTGHPLMAEAANALEAARAKLDALKTDRDQLAEHDQAVGDELNRVINERAVPEGWRLVPAEPTEEWIEALAKSYSHDPLTILDEKQAAASRISRMLAAAPEISDDR